MKFHIITMALVLFFSYILVAGEMPALYPHKGAADYSGVLIKKMPVAVQCWTFRKFTLFEALDKIKALGVKYVEIYPGQQIEKGHAEAAVSHTMSEEQMEKVKTRLDKLGLQVVSYGVVGFENTEQEVRQVFEFAEKMGIRVIVIEPRFDDFSIIEAMVKAYDIPVALHNHPPPSKYARPETAFNFIDGLDKRIGICGDTGHWLRTGVKPTEALRMLQGRIYNLHLKDLNAFGKREAHDVPFGSGVANVEEILAELTLQDYRGNIVVEYEYEAEADNPSPSIAKGLEYIKRITYFGDDYQNLLGGSWWGYSKHGWNHYGPGFFELDQSTGVLTARGGMGLFWYSAEKFKDFVLELDFMVEKEHSNSGIFIRVPEIPVNDDYIYHSFEIQICNNGESVHQTGAVYDASAPSDLAFKPAGEWNHYKITFKGNNIRVELNGKLVNDWNAKPAGKIKDFAEAGYIGLQNHDDSAKIFFRNVYVKEL
jgi:sugar phosphate isomerase/epimerase